MPEQDSVMLPLLSEIKVISFDVDGTLWDFDGAMRYALRQSLQELGQRHPEAVSLLNVERMIEIRDQTHESLRGMVTDLERVRLESFRRSLESVGRPDDGLALRLCMTYFERRDSKRIPFPDVIPSIDALKDRYKLGILSNGNTCPKLLGLGESFEFIVMSPDHNGIEKPDPRLFEIALSEANCTPEELLHVGDSEESDVLGAKHIGVKSVWVNREGHSSVSGTAADFQVSSLIELKDIL